MTRGLDPLGLSERTEGLWLRSCQTAVRSSFSHTDLVASDDVYIINDILPPTVLRTIRERARQLETLTREIINMNSTN